MNRTNVIDRERTQYRIGQPSELSFPTSIRVHKSGHGYSVGQVLRSDAATTYALAKADTLANSAVVGIVSAVITADIFILTNRGLVTGLSGLVAGLYYLDKTTAGAITTSSTQISVPVLVAISANSAYVIGGAPSFSTSLLSPGSAGTALSWDGFSIGWRAPTGIYTSSAVLTGSGTFTPGVVAYRAILVGGGGGGASSVSGSLGYYASSSNTTFSGATASQINGGGGGGGAGSIAWVDIYDPSMTAVAYSVGSGGTAGNNGSNTTFGIYTAYGGKTGTAVSGGVVGRGGDGGGKSASGAGGNAMSIAGAPGNEGGVAIVASALAAKGGNGYILPGLTQRGAGGDAGSSGTDGAIVYLY